MGEKNRTCRCYIDDTKIDPIIIRKATIDISPITVFAGPHAVGKSTIAFNIVRQLTLNRRKDQKDQYEKNGRYKKINMRCECKQNYRAFVLPAERVLLPYYNRICDPLLRLINQLERQHEGLKDVIQEPSYEALFREILDANNEVCEYLSGILSVKELSVPLDYWKEIIKVIDEINNNVFKNIYETLEFLQHIKEDEGVDIAVFQNYYGLPYELVRHNGSIFVMDKRAEKDQELYEVSLGIAPAVVFYGLVSAAQSAYWKPTLLLVEEPEEEAHPYAQYYIGYSTAYMAIRLNKFIEKKRGNQLVIIITTHSQYILSGIYAAIEKLQESEENIPLPDIYTLDYEKIEKDKSPIITINKWNPKEQIIPGFFTAEEPILVSPLTIRKLHESKRN